MSNSQLQEPEGISFYNVTSDETHYAKLEPTIAAYINSSDMGINASRGQDYGWKLGAEWVKKVREFRRDAMQMRILQANNNGQKPTTTQILYYLYGEEMRAYQEEQDENEQPYLDKYQKAIADTPASRTASAPKTATPDPLPAVDDDDDDDIADLIDDVVTEDEPASHTVNRDAGDGQFVTAEEAKANPGTTVTETVKTTAKPGRPPKSTQKAQ